MRTKKNAVPGMQIQSFREVYMTFQSKNPPKPKALKPGQKPPKPWVPCNCPKGVMCSKCRVSIPCSLETVIDGTKARYCAKHESVTIISPPKVTQYRSGTPTGETVPGEVWKGSLGEFQRRFGMQFVGLCLQGWAAAKEAE